MIATGSLRRSYEPPISNALFVGVYKPADEAWDRGCLGCRRRGTGRRCRSQTAQGRAKNRRVEIANPACAQAS
jgi:hypothetical protein